MIAQSNASSPPGYSAMATGPPDWACARASVHPLLGVHLKPEGPKPHGDVGPKVPGLFKGVAVGNNVICVALEWTTRMLPNHPHSRVAGRNLTRRLPRIRT